MGTQCSRWLIAFSAGQAQGSVDRCLDSMERGTVEWNSGMVGGASLLNVNKCITVLQSTNSHVYLALAV